MLAALAELTSISLISPYIKYISESNKEGLFYKFEVLLGLPEGANGIFGLFLLLFLFLASCLSAFSLWKLANFAARIGVNVANSLYSDLANSTYINFSNNNKSDLINLITNESTRLTDQIIQPLMIINAKILLVVFIGCVMVTLSPLLSLLAITSFLLTYIILYLVVRKRLENNGRDITKSNVNRLFIIEDTVGLFKEFKIYNLIKKQISTFEKFGDTLAKKKGESAAISQIPRYIIEYLALSLIILAFLVQSQSSNSIVDIIATLSGFGAAAFKILPAAQQIYQSLAVIKANSSALHEIVKMMDKNRVVDPDKAPDGVEFKYNQNIEINNVDFVLPTGKKILNNVNLNIKKGQKIGIVGASGAGKSTFISFLLGLISPSNGHIKIDGTEVKNCDVGYKELFGYVPQDIFLIKGTLAENIAIGVEKEKIDLDRVNRCLRVTRLLDYVNSLSSGVHTIVDNSNLMLSGGQKQRIVIARALYRQPSVLIFDEATSALDGINENLIVNSILEEDNETTIIMVAHRLKSLEDCNIIYIFDNGEVIASGTYNYLIESSKHFQRLNGDMDEE